LSEMKLPESEYKDTARDAYTQNFYELFAPDERKTRSRSTFLSLFLVVRTLFYNFGPINSKKQIGQNYYDT